MSEFPVSTTELSRASSNIVASMSSRNITMRKKLIVNAPRIVANSTSYLDWLLKNQITSALSIIGATVFLYIFHQPSRIYTEKLLFLSYPSPDGNGYQQGIEDTYYVLAWVVHFTALRAITIDWILCPMASFLSVEKKNNLRFAEQGWLVIYYSIFWTMGMYLWISSDYWLNNKAIWHIWPAREMSGPFKFYNLVQLAFWIQQILVIHIEKRRKDHAQMLTHHIITCVLISVTFVYRYTRATNVVLCLMDVVDLLLPLAKVLRYLSYEKACNTAFGLLVVSWFTCRHVMYLQLCYDIYTDVPSSLTMEFGCYSNGSRTPLPNTPSHPDYFSHLLWPFQSSAGDICLNTEVKWIFLSMLGFLQLLSMIWFTMVLRVLWGIFRGQKSEDIRSDDEDEGEEDTEEEDVNGVDSKEKKSRQMNITDLEICVSSGGIDEPVRISPKPRTTNARRRPGVLEKEILNRIGCEKPQ